MFLTLLLWSGCKDENDPGTTEPEEVKIEVTTQNADGQSLVFATSATFKLNLQGVESFVYEVKEGDVTEEPDPVVMYANANEEGGSGVITAKNGENETTVNGLLGNTKYTIFFAFKCGKEYQVEKVVFTTTDYTDILTLISVDYDGMTFHVNVGDDVYYRLGITEAENYFGMKEQFFMSDVDFLNSGVVYHGSQTIKIKNGDAINPEWPDNEFNKYNIFYPGGTYMLMLGECNAEGEMSYEVDNGGNPGFPGGLMSRSIQDNVSTYTEEFSEENITFNGKYAKMRFWTKFPESVENEAKVSLIKKTERSIKLSVKPGKDVINYGAVIFDEDNCDIIERWFGDKGLQTAVLFKSQQFTGNQEIEYTDLEVGKKYRFFVISNYNEDLTKQSFYVQDFEITPSTNPKSELTVTPVESNNPYSVAFNIKALNKDCYGIRYLANYTKDWASAPYDDATMLSTYGVDVTDKEIMDQINSENGYNMEFGSWENSETKIVLLSYNVDEAPSDEIFSCTAMSAPETGTPLQSEVFDKITGTWNLKYTYRKYKTGEQQTVEFPVVFTQTAEEAPATLPEDVHAALLEYWKGFGYSDTEAEAKIDEYVADYKESAEKYTQKYKDMNRIVGNGFKPLHDYYGTWDLFCNMNYSAYDTDELFYDFGPKIYLQVMTDNEGNEEIGLVTYENAIPPVSSGITYYDYYMYGENVEDEGWGYSNVTYPVELSEDGKTLTIKGFYDKSVSPYTLYPSIAYLMSGYPFYQFYGDGDIVLTKTDDSEDLGAVRTSTTGSRTVGTNGLKSVSPVRKSGRMMRTYIPNEKTTLKFNKTTVKYSPVDWSSKSLSEWSLK